MRALSDLAALGNREYVAVISANGHAFKIPGMRADFIVCKDHYHTETKKRMEPQLREHGVPIISRHYWADYRATDWKFQGNSGLMAILVAGILGGGPIYPIGFDAYQLGIHWHDPNAKNISKGRSLPEVTRKAEKIASELAGTIVRPVSGFLCEVFRRFERDAELPDYKKPAIIDQYRDMPALKVRVLNPTHLPFDGRAQILPGQEFWVSETEYKNLRIERNAKILDRRPAVQA